MKLSAQGTAILDPTSDMDEVLATLEDLHNTMNELQEKATEYKGYQKQFKVRISSIFPLFSLNSTQNVKHACNISLIKHRV